MDLPLKEEIPLLWIAIGLPLAFFVVFIVLLPLMLYCFWLQYELLLKIYYKMSEFCNSAKFMAYFRFLEGNFCPL